MPYIKTKKEPKLTMLLRSYRLNGESLAKILGCTPVTANKRLNDPELFTLGDLYKVNRRAHIPIDEIREAIGG